MERGRDLQAVRYSVLLVAQEAPAALHRRLVELDDQLGRLLLPYEIICIDDGCGPSISEMLSACLESHPRLRVLRFESPRGACAALAAGIAAARGELILGMGLEQMVADDVVPQLISRLGRADFVFAEPRRTFAQFVRHSLTRTVRMLVAARDSVAHDELLFAARREALAGLTLARGAFRLLPEFVAQRGFRVCRVNVGAGLPPRGSELRIGPLRRLTAAWLSRRFEPHLAQEVARRNGASAPPAYVRRERIVQRADRAAPIAPVQHEPGGSL
ncbi:MAG: glycosyltransferase [Pirellulales bacterium]